MCPATENSGCFREERLGTKLDFKYEIFIVYLFIRFELCSMKNPYILKYGFYEGKSI